MEVLHWLVCHLKVQVIRIKPGTERHKRCKLVGSHPKQTFVDTWMDLSTVPLDGISKHDDDFGTRLDCVDEVLGQERGPCLLPVSVKIAPSLVVPHSGRTGFTCQDTDSVSIILSDSSTFKMRRPVHTLHYNAALKMNTKLNWIFMSEYAREVAG